MKIKAFDRPQCHLMRSEIEAALDPIAKKYGIDVTVGPGSFTPKNYRAKIEMSVIGADGVKEGSKDDFDSMAVFFGLASSDFNKKFVHGTNVMQITGIKPRSKKYPILCTDTKNGKVFKFPANTVKALLQGSKHLNDPNAQH